MAYLATYWPRLLALGVVWAISAWYAVAHLRWLNALTKREDEE